MLIRLLTTAGVLALVVTTAPPALAAPEDVLRPGQIVTIAGFDEPDYGGVPQDGVSGDGGDARFARIGGEILSIDVGPDGSVYLAEAFEGRLRRIDPNGVINTVPGTWVPPTRENRDAGLVLDPAAVTVASDGTIYAGTGEIWRIVPGGASTIIAGAGELNFEDGGTGGDGGPATSADLGEASDIEVDAAGNVYVADLYRDHIRKIDQNGVISTLAGGGTLDRASAEGGPATAAVLNRPTSLAADAKGNVYFIEDKAATIRKVDQHGTITTVVGQRGAGFSGDGGPAAEGQIGTQSEFGGGITTDAEDNLYLLDRGFIRQIGADGTLATVGPSIPADGDIAAGPDGNIYVASETKILMLVRNGKGKPVAAPPARVQTPEWAGQDPGTVVTVAGNGKEPPKPDESRLFGDDVMARWVATGPDGTAYLSDTLHHRVLAMAPDGKRRVFAGTGKAGDHGDGGPATKAGLELPKGIAVDGDGTVYIADGKDRIRKVATDGTITTHTAAKATDLAVDGAGNLYATGEGVRGVSKIDTAGAVTTFAGDGDRYGSDADGHPAVEAYLATVGPVAVDAAGTVYFATDRAAAIYRVGQDGILGTVIGDSQIDGRNGGFTGDGGPAEAGLVNNVSGLATGADGALYFADTYNNRVRKIDAVGIVTTVAGTGPGKAAGDGGPAAEAALAEPRKLAVAPDGTIYLTNRFHDRVRRIDAGGTIDTITGIDGGESARDDGRPATETVLGSQPSITVDPAGRLHLTDSSGVLRRVGADGRLTVLEPEDMYGNDLASGPDGSLYLANGTTLERRFPDGTTMTVAGGGLPDTPVTDGMRATNADLDVGSVAVGRHGEIYLVSGFTVFQVRADGTLAKVARVDGTDGDYGVGGISSLAAGPDGSLYVTLDNRVFRIDEAGTVSAFAGTGKTYGPDGNGDGGPATEAIIVEPTDLAVANDGTVYIGTFDDIHRVTPDGEIGTVMSDEENTVRIELALDPHGNLYYVANDRVMAMVTPGEITDPFAWSALIWGAVIFAVLGVIGYGIFRHRRNNPGLFTGWGTDNLSNTP